MASSSFTPEKIGLDDPSSSFSQTPKKSSLLSAISPLTSLYARLAEWRKSLDLPNPGMVENLQKEVKRVSPNHCHSLAHANFASAVTHLTNFMFDGARADLSKNLSMNPAFQISHSFNLGSQVASPSYNFGALYATNSVTCHLSLSHVTSRKC